MWVFRSLCVVAAVLSLVMLAKLGLSLESFAAPLQITIDYYESWMQFFLGWAEPPLKALLAAIQNVTGWHLLLFSHWKHVLVLMWLYFGADARTYWARGKRTFAGIAVGWGGLVALISSIASGIEPFQYQSADLLIVAFPIGGVVVYELGIIGWKIILFPSSTSSMRETIRSGTVSFVLPTLAIGASALIAGAKVRPDYVRYSTHGFELALLALFVSMLAVFRLARGVWTATFDRDPNESWRARFARSGSTRIATLMLTAVVGAAAFIATNAGLKLCGL